MSHTETRGESEQWSTFFLADEMFAVRVEDVQEVIMHQPLTPVPLAPEYVVGLLNLRGQIIPAVDLRSRLRFEARVPTGEEKLLVLKTNEGLLSVVVDEIGDVLELPSAAWRSPPETLARGYRTFVLGICPIEGHLVLGLKIAALTAEDPSHGSKS
jgi:purine-binding chemotaxis protein CheW